MTFLGPCPLQSHKCLHGYAQLPTYFDEEVIKKQYFICISGYIHKSKHCKLGSIAEQICDTWNAWKNISMGMGNFVAIDHFL